RSREQCGVVDRLPGRTFLASRRDTHAFNLRGALACGALEGSVPRAVQPASARGSSEDVSGESLPVPPTTSARLMMRLVIVSAPCGHRTPHLTAQDAVLSRRKVGTRSCAR
ncbi:hypothetical protein ACFC1R_23900, partial [Kitasatospora sp. NPDC056138]|uniref:hypothetical protein n=1 Tax=Kitasatospora sp. NPDC056138 TaxID=3345724 RepID=UPI0035DFF810